MREKRPGWAPILLGAFFVPIGSLHASVATESSSQLTGVGIERGVTRIVCVAQNSEQRRRTRAIILNAGDAGLAHDVLLAPAHGLPNDRTLIKRECSIQGGEGPSTEIADFWLPPDRGGADEGDWVVLLTETALAGNVGRVNANQLDGEYISELVDNEVAVRLILYSENLDQQDCRILDEEPRSRRGTAIRVFFHSCRVWPGVSGAPMVIDRDGEAFMVGFNIGQRLRISESGKPLSMGIARVIDAEIAVAIRQATERSREIQAVSEQASESLINTIRHTDGRLFPGRFKRR